MQNFHPNLNFRLNAKYSSEPKIFTYLKIWENSGFLAGNSNAKCKYKFSPKLKIFPQTKNFHPNLEFSPKTQNYRLNAKFSSEPKSENFLLGGNLNSKCKMQNANGSALNPSLQWPCLLFVWHAGITFASKSGPAGALIHRAKSWLPVRPVSGDRGAMRKEPDLPL